MSLGAFALRMDTSGNRMLKLDGRDEDGFKSSRQMHESRLLQTIARFCQTLPVKSHALLLPRHMTFHPTCCKCCAHAMGGGWQPSTARNQPFEQSIVQPPS